MLSHPANATDLPMLEQLHHTYPTDLYDLVTVSYAMFLYVRDCHCVCKVRTMLTCLEYVDYTEVSVVRSHKIPDICTHSSFYHG